MQRLHDPRKTSQAEAQRLMTGLPALIWLAYGVHGNEISSPDAALVTVLDGHPATHAWLGSVRGQRVIPLGPDHFGQSGDIPDLYREYGIDADAILDACAQALLAG